MDGEIHCRCHRCDGLTLDVCIACRRHTCRACGRVAVELLRYLGLQPGDDVPALVPLPVICPSCRAR